MYITYFNVEANPTEKCNFGKLYLLTFLMIMIIYEYKAIIRVIYIKSLMNYLRNAHNPNPSLKIYEKTNKQVEIIYFKCQ